MFWEQGNKNNITKLNTKIKLGQKEFIDLAKGKQITIGNTDIILEDIGYDSMLNIIRELKENLGKESEIKNLGLKILEFCLIIFLIIGFIFIENSFLYSIGCMFLFYYCLLFDNDILDSKIF